MPLFPLRPLQQSALDALKSSISAGKRRIVVQAPTGFGKTILGAHMVAGALAKGNRVAFAVPMVSLVDQTVERFVENGISPGDIGVMQANHPLRRSHAPLQVCSVQTIDKRGFPDVKFVVVDECFVAGTKISTPHGERPIETLSTNDHVINATGVGRVLAVSKKMAKPLVVRLSNGGTLRVTENHRLFTDGGWVQAGKLEVGARLFSAEGLRALWTGNAPERESTSGRECVAQGQMLLSEMRGVVETASERAEGSAQKLEGGFGFRGNQDLRALRGDFPASGFSDAVGSGSYFQKGALLLNFLLEEVSEPDEQSCDQREGWRDLASDLSFAASSWGKWSSAVRAAASAFASSRSGMGAGGGGADEGRSLQRNISDLLQVGHCEQGNEGRCRSGREEPQRKAQGFGSEEGCAFGDVWVEDISRDERAGDVPVYNLHVSGHPSYFAGGVLVHNCHLRFKAIDRWIATRPDVLFIGLTATPWSAGMGEVWDDLIIPTRLRELIDLGWLSPFRIFAASKPDLSGVKIVAGEFHEGQLSEVMSSKQIVADVVSTWLEKGECRPTLCFAVDRAHADGLYVQFKEAGVASAYIDGDTPREERTAVLSLYKAGKVQVICSVGTMTTGIDVPCRCIIMARPTKSEILWVQMAGRGLRTEPGKDDCIIFDHAGNGLRLGLPTEVGRTSLRTAKTDAAEKKAKAEGAAKTEPMPRECKGCGCLMPAKVRKCEACGSEFKRQSDVETIDGELVEMGAKPKAGKKTATERLQAMGRREVWAQILGIAGQRGWKEGRAAHLYKSIFGTWPRNMNDTAPASPCSDLLSFEHAKRIAFAKSRDAQRKAGSATQEDGKALADAA